MVTDLRVTEQGQQAEVRAGGGKKDFFIFSMSRNQNNSESGSTPELSGVWGAKNSRESSRGVLIGENIVA